MAETIELKIKEGEKELKFRIKKMDAFKAEAWMIQAGMLLGKELSSIQDFKDSKSLIRALCSVTYEKARPLLDELLGCCYFVDDKYEKCMTEDAVKSIIRSPKTLLTLRVESAKANFSFLLDGNLFDSL